MGKGKQIHKQMSTSGGRATEHGVSWALEFQPALNSQEDMYWEGEPYKSKKLGHNCIVVFKKSTNEKTGNNVRYPIIYRATNGNSIWVEKECVDLALAFSLIKRKGPWFSFDDSIIEEAKKANLELKTQIQGIDAVYTYFETEKPVFEWFLNKIKTVIS